MLNAPDMIRSSALAAAFAVLAPLAASAGARTIEIGATPRTPAVPACPAAPCLAISRTTGYQAKVGTDRGLMTVPANGRIVAWTIALSKPNAAQVKYFSQQLGGPAQAGLTILRPGKRIADGHVVKASGPLVALAPYFGSSPQFPLATAIPVRKGDVVALTVPTWAPALQVGLGNDTSWRAARGKKQCKDNTTQTSQLEVGDKAVYYCLYRTARLAYSATLIPYPKKTTRPKAQNGGRNSR